MSERSAEPSLIVPGLPVAMTPLIGREDIVRDLITRLHDPAQRLLTLTGPGGVGKTRVATELLRRTADAFDERAWFVSLSQIDDPTFLPATVARVVAGTEAAVSRPEETLRFTIGERPTIIVFDNFEHVLPAAEFVLSLLNTFPQLKVVVTSREALRVRPEQVYPIPPLALTDDSDSPEATSDAVVLFLDCVRAMRPGYQPTGNDLETISQICLRLDGLPLAIELAAARCRALSPRALLARLDDGIGVLSQGPRDLPERQRTMADTIAWSVGLLHEQDRAVFRRISTFRGAFTLEAAEFVLGHTGASEQVEPIEPEMVLDGVSSLLDKNLLREKTSADGEQRFVMLRTLRDFATQMLVRSGEHTEIEARHANWCLRRAGEAWRHTYRDAFEPEWFPKLEEEHDDFRAVLSRLESQSDGTAMLTLATDLTPFWFFHSHRNEGSAWLERACNIIGWTSLPMELRAKTRHCQGLLLLSRTEATLPLRESVDLFRQLGDEWGRNASSLTLATTLNAIGLFDEAMEPAREAVENFRADGYDRLWYGNGLLEYGNSELGLGRLAMAEEHTSKAREVAREESDVYGICVASQSLALIHLEARAIGPAGDAVREGLDSWNNLRMHEALAGLLLSAAAIAALNDDVHRAGLLYGASERVARLNNYAYPVLEQRALKLVLDRLGNKPGSDWQALVASGGELDFDAAVELARSVCSGPITNPADRTSTLGLTARELEVIRLLAEGLSDREIGESLFVSRATAARHVANIFLKIDVNSRTAAAAWAFRNGLIPGPRL